MHLLEPLEMSCPELYRSAGDTPGKAQMRPVQHQRRTLASHRDSAFETRLTCTWGNHSGPAPETHRCCTRFSSTVQSWSPTRVRAPGEALMGTGVRSGQRWEQRWESTTSGRAWIAAGVSLAAACPALGSYPEEH
jgi:hypothetical protein